MNIISITSRKLCRSSFLTQIEKIAIAKPRYIILREKDLTEAEYEALAKSVLEVCRNYNVPLICNTYFNTAKRIGADGIHLPLEIAKKGGYGSFKYFGISTHSLQDAEQAHRLGADYITFGHIFETDCKKGLAPRGVKALADVVKHSKIPVYAIGGITPQNADEVINCGAEGICLMSSLMTSDKPSELLQKFGL